MQWAIVHFLHVKLVPFLEIHDKVTKLTNPTLNQSPVCRNRKFITKGHDWRSHLSKTECFRRGCECIVGVCGARNNLSEEFGVDEMLTGEDLRGPVHFCGVEDGLVEDVVVAEVGVGATYTSVVLEDVVAVQIVADGC